MKPMTPAKANSVLLRHEFSEPESSKIYFHSILCHFTKRQILLLGNGTHNHHLPLYYEVVFNFNVKGWKENLFRDY